MRVALKPNRHYITYACIMSTALGPARGSRAHVGVWWLPPDVECQCERTCCSACMLHRTCIGKKRSCWGSVTPTDCTRAPVSQARIADALPACLWAGHRAGVWSFHGDTGMRRSTGERHGREALGHGMERTSVGQAERPDGFDRVPATDTRFTGVRVPEPDPPTHTRACSRAFQRPEAVPGAPTCDACFSCGLHTAGGLANARCVGGPPLQKRWAIECPAAE